ncbi:hypothetical protein QQG55_38190 [Brugia pahangi]
MQCEVTCFTNPTWYSHSLCTKEYMLTEEHQRNSMRKKIYALLVMQCKKREVGRCFEGWKITQLQKFDIRIGNLKIFFSQFQ